MPTSKRRIPVTLSPELESYLEEFAKTHDVSLSQAIILLVRYGADLAEDDYFGLLADDLDTKVKTYQEHDQFWSKVLP